MAETIGFIGTGLMGNPMCSHLLAAGYQLVIYDIRPEVMAPLLALGASAASSPADAGRRSGKVITMLPNSSIVEEVVQGKDGLAEGFHEGSLLIDMSSSEPSSTRRISSSLESKGVRMIDAPVTGGMPGAEAGTLTIMVGGIVETYEECLPVLRAMGKNIYHIGPIGTGHTMKTVNNMMGAINLVGVCEALVLGTKAGLDPATIIEVCSKGSATSGALEKCRNVILGNNFAPGFTTDLMYKDLSIAMNLGRELGVPLLEGSLVHQILGIARGRGMNALDIACVVKLIEEAAGVRVAPE